MTEESTTVDLHGGDEIDEAIRDTIALAQRKLLIVAPQLDQSVFMRPGIRDCLRHLVIGGRDNEIRILVSHEKRVIRANAHLIEMTRRHSSRVTLRCMPVDLALADELVVIADGDHAVHIPDLDHETGQQVTHNRAVAGVLLERMRPWWERSEQPRELFTAGL